MPPSPSSVDHYENFPVASLLCPAALRPAIVAIYHFARTADDLADEGSHTADARLQSLAAYRLALDRTLTRASENADDSAPWASVMQPLRTAVIRHALPVSWLHNLLSAFEHDVEASRDGSVHADLRSLQDYARLSANPVGRLLLHLYGVASETALQQSDAICTALQLFNFWQDLSVDVSRGRYYLPADLCAQFHVDPRCPQQAHAMDLQMLMEELLAFSTTLMRSGMGLPGVVRAAAGWKAGLELRLVIEGGLRIGRRTRALGASIAQHRPALGAGDLPGLLLSALLLPAR